MLYHEDHEGREEKIRENEIGLNGGGFGETVIL